MGTWANEQHRMSAVVVTTPGGHEARFWCRVGTNDRMTVEGDVEQDRYGLATLPKTGGLFVDIGTHIGTVLVAHLLDDPEATAIAVEPLADNVERIQVNADENGVADRLLAIHERAFSPSTRYVDIPWSFTSKSDPESAEMHTYIGGFNLDLMPADVEYDVARVPGMTAGELLTDDVAVLKVAGETSEQALIGADLSRVDIVLGKYHSELPELVPWLRKTHTVTIHADKDKPLTKSFGWYRGTR